VVTFIFTQKMGRFFEFPTALHFTDLCLVIFSSSMIGWYMRNVVDNIDVLPNGLEEEK